MTTAVCQAADILGVRRELLNEMMILINMTSGVKPQNHEKNLSSAQVTLLLDDLIDEYCRKL